MNYTSVIGLEIHAELKTKTKIFCGCANDFGSEKNSRCCPVCTGFPGALPVLNRHVIELAIAAGLVFGCDITRLTKWDRKNYFYPDLPKAYQISQLYAPLCVGGGMDIGGRFIRLNRIHVEEDAGKLIHERDCTYIDYNRACVPLIEIVTEPDIHTADEAVAFVERVRQALVYAGVCDGKMEQGSLRVDANISIMPEGASELGTRTEIKNLNSFKFIKKAIDFEIKRQEEIVNKGGKVVQETRRYDETSGETFSMRSKEDAHDYRYFPDPDILPLFIEQKEIDSIREQLSEPPYARWNRYTKEVGLSERDADTILANKFVADFYDELVCLGAEPKNAANLVKGELLYCIKQAETKVEVMPIAASEFIKIIELQKNGKISLEGLKVAVYHMFHEQKNADEVVKEHNLVVTEDRAHIESVIAQVLADNEAAVMQYKEGNEKVLSYFLGQCNKVLKGQALPKTIQEALKKALGE